MRRALLMASALCAAAACGTGEFDKLADEAPVQVVERPAEFGTQSFGTVFLPLATRLHEPQAAGMVVVSGTEQLALVLVTATAGGKLSAQPLPPAAFTDLHGAPVTAMAELRDASAGKILLGSPTAAATTRPAGAGGVTRIMTLGSTVTLAQGPSPADAQAGFGSAVASGLISGGPARDMVVTSDTDVNLFEDGAVSAPVQTHQPAPAACAVALDAGLELSMRRRRALVVDDIAAAAGDEIVLGVPRTTGDGVVQVLTRTVAAGKSELTCSFSLAPPAGTYQGRSRFGAALATGDFNKDGKRDLLIGAPPDRAFVYLGAVTAASVPVVLMPSDGSPAVSFGGAVAAMNMDGQGGDEAIVSDWRRKVADDTEVGEIGVFALGSGTPPTVVRLQPLQPVAGMGLGMGVGGMRFCNSVPEPCPDGQPIQRLLVAGTSSALHVFFSLGEPAVPDLRRTDDRTAVGDAGAGDARDAGAETRDAPGG